MFVIALGCVVAGTWQISRYEQTGRINRVLDANAHAAAVALTTGLVPLVHHGPSPSREAIRYRTVTVSGSYLPGDPELVRDQSVNGTSGYYVLSPLRAADGIVLVVRGFVPDGGQDVPPTTIAAPPTGTVQVTGRLQTPSSTNDGASELSHNEIESINPSDQAARIDDQVYNAYLTLNANQPGTDGVTALPEPDLSNPAGGAVEPQHLAYIIQWYLFALLALVAPFAIARHEVAEAQQRFLGIDPARRELGDDRPQLTSGESAPGAAVAVRASGELARPDEPTPAEWQRAAQLADRYGRSLGVGQVAAAVRAARTGRPPRPAGGNGPRWRSSPTRLEYERDTATSATRPHRSDDGYHGAYNDYLWELALGDGAAPEVVVPKVVDAETHRPDGPPKPEPTAAD
jgi:cytochrome oxidase assembly protein ShyY1